MTSTATRTSGRESAWVAGAIAVAIVSIATMITHGWVPLDEGTIALSARYAALGYLPHRDFAYPYSGALPYWNALAMGVFGDSMSASRYAIIGPFIAWLTAVWYLARRFVPAHVAASLIVLSAWWSLLIYPAAMPTWYLLFLTTWSLEALARWSEGGKLHWLAAAGLMCGLAITIKQTGAYTLAGCAVAVLALTQGNSAGVGRTQKSESAAQLLARLRFSALPLFALGITAGVPLFIIGQRGPVSGEALLLGFPTMAVLAALAVREWRNTSPDHVRRVVVAGTVLAGSAAVPVAILAAWYQAHGALASLVDGALAGGALTAKTLVQTLPPAIDIIALGFPVVAVAVAVGALSSARWRMLVGTTLALELCVAAMYSDAVYRAIWYFAMLLLPLGTGIAAWRAVRAQSGDRDRTLHLAMAGVTALLALNMFPYGKPNYFGYVAPLAIVVAATVVVAGRGTGGRGLPAMAAAGAPFALTLLLVFGGWFHRIGSVGTVGDASVWWDDAHPLPGIHGGLRVTRSDSSRYDRAVQLIAEHGGAESLAAGPELPELYVLAGTRRVVPQPYRLVASAAPDSQTFALQLDTTRTTVLAINHAPKFLPRVSDEVIAWLAAHYPASERIDDIELRWRTSTMRLKP